MTVSVNLSYDGNHFEWKTDSPILSEKNGQICDAEASALIENALLDLDISLSKRSLVHDVTIRHNGKTIFHQKSVKKRRMTKSKIKLFYNRNSLMIYISFIAIFALYALLATEFPLIAKSVSFANTTVESINKIVAALSSSYIAGYIFYIVTVYIPFIHKQNIVKKHLAEELRYLKDTLDGAFRDTWGADWAERLEFCEMFYKDYLKDSDKKTIKPRTQQYIYEIVKITDNHILTILKDAEYLYEDELETLYYVMHSYAFAHIRCRFNDVVCIDHDEAINILKGLQNEFKAISWLYVQMGIEPTYISETDPKNIAE